MNRRDKLQQRIFDLQSELASSKSSIGDWKWIKHQNLLAQGKTSTLDVDEYLTEREKVRDKINLLEKELAALDDTQS